MKQIITFLGMLFFLLCGWLPALQGQTTCYTVWQDDTAGTLSVYNNIVYGNSAGVPSSVAVSPAYSGAMAANAVDVNPGFTSAANYLITTGSTATFNTGLSGYNKQYIDDKQDIQGYARVQGSGVDMGAYEVGTVSKSFPYTAAAVSNGSLSVMNGTTPVTDGAYIPLGTSLSVTATPNSGYTFVNLTVNGTLYTTNSYTFTVTGATNISAVFIATVAAVYDETGGINLYNNVVYGNTGVVPGNVSSMIYQSVLKDLTGNTTNAVDVNPGFTSVVNYLITTGSTATYNTGNSSYNSPNVTDIQGYARIQGTNIDKGAYEVGTAVLCFVSIPAITNGSISVMNGVTPVINGTPVNSETALTVTATPNSGYAFVNLTVNGTVYTTNPYTFTVTGATTISASFIAAVAAVAAVSEDAGTLNLYNNVVYGNTGVVPADVSSIVSMSILKDLTGNTTNAVDLIPGFTSAANYLITTGSAATYNTGTSGSANPYLQDIQGYARIQGTCVDKGAYEVGTSTLSTFTSVASGSANWSSTSSWTGNMVPALGSVVTVQNDLTIDQDVNLNSLILAPGARLTLATGKTLTATTLTINSDATGTGTFVDNGTSKITTANVQQYLTGNRNWYLSSPVAGPTVAALTGTTAVYSYNESTSAWVTETSGAVMTPGKGYVAANGATSGAVTFSGTLNNGAQSSALTRSGTTSIGFNLAGNPYPSYVNWESATKTNLEPTIWYRSKNAGNTAYVYDTYSATGHVGTGLNGTNVTALIPPMQAFWVRVDPLYTSGTLAFDNTMRSHGSGINPLKVKAADSTPVQKILRLQVSNGVNHDEAIVLFNTNASDGYDTYDSEKISNANPAVPELYTLVGTEKCVINGLNAVTLNEELPLGFTTGEANTFSIQATEASNFDADTQILLKDNLLNTEQELVVGTAYVFASDVVSSASRFSVVFKSASVTTGIEPANQDNQQVMVYKNANNKLVVTRSAVSSTEGNITVTNAMGQKLVNVSTTGSITVIDKSFGSGVYVVTVTTDGKSTTKKVIMN